MARDSKRESSLPASFKIGAIALVFMVIGYQVALFVRQAAVSKIAAAAASPDTVYVVDRDLALELLQEAGCLDGAGGLSGRSCPEVRGFSEELGSPENHGGLSGRGGFAGSGGPGASGGGSEASWSGPGSGSWCESGGNALARAGNAYSGGKSGGNAPARAGNASSGGESGENAPARAGDTRATAAGDTRAAAARNGCQTRIEMTDSVVTISRSSRTDVQRQILSSARRSYESFPFNPNTVSLEDLQRLGFSEKQAAAIDNYRQKGGRFRRKEDFQRSFVVADSVYRRLEGYIRIPKLDINAADSAAFDALPGIGPYFAAKMVSYRRELGGAYSYAEQLMDIYRFDEEKFRGLADLVEVGPGPAYRLWELPEDSLRLHPYIRSSAVAHGIALFRDNTPRGEWSVDALAAQGILSPDSAAKLRRCRIAPPTR